jgi:hypothetical protein
MEDELDWDLGPFLEGRDEWLSVYTIDFIKKLAIAIEVDWQIILAGISNGQAYLTVPLSRGRLKCPRELIVAGL